MIKDQAVIAGDVERSFLCIKECNESEQNMLRRRLSTVLNGIITQNPGTRYYQGLHDIAGGFLLVLDPERALLATEAVCKYYIPYLFCFRIGFFVSHQMVLTLSGLNFSELISC